MFPNLPNQPLSPSLVLKLFGSAVRNWKCSLKVRVAILFFSLYKWSTILVWPVTSKGFFCSSLHNTHSKHHWRRDNNKTKRSLFVYELLPPSQFYLLGGFVTQIKKTSRGWANMWLKVNNKTLKVDIEKNLLFQSSISGIISRWEGWAFFFHFRWVFGTSRNIIVGS